MTIRENRRVNPRPRLRLRARVSTGAAATPATTLDISHTGLSVATDRPLPEGTQVTVQIDLPVGGQVALTGQVVWSVRVSAREALSRKSSMGLRLVAPADMRFLELVSGEIQRAVHSYCLRSPRAA